MGYKAGSGTLGRAAPMDRFSDGVMFNLDVVATKFRFAGHLLSSCLTDADRCSIGWGYTSLSDCSMVC
jgi:hypothetical protein